MAEILFVRVGKARGRMDLGIADGGEKRILSVSDGIYRRLGEPVRGASLDGEALDTLLREDENYRAMKRALSILGYADNSMTQLVTKLRRAGFSRTVAAWCAEECRRLGYIDEERQLRRFVIAEAGRLRGPKYIGSKLRARGYSYTMIGRVISELSAGGEVDFDRNLDLLDEKMGDGTDEGKKRLAFKYGY